MDKQDYIKNTVGIVVEKVASGVRLSDLGGFTMVHIESGHPDANHGDLCKWISGLLSAAYDQGAASKDTVSTVNEAALALANEERKAWEAKVKEQDKSLAKIAELIGLDEQSRPFQIIDRVRTQAACQKTMDEYLEHIAETVGLTKDSPWCSIASRVSEVQEICKEALAQASRDADEIIHLKAKAKEWEAASRNARQQGFDEAVAIVDRHIEYEEVGVEKAKARVSCLRNIAGALRNAVLCDDE